MSEHLKTELRKLWIPLQKTESGEYRGILSDTSIDRDDECMSKDLLESWAENKSLPTLVDHQNTMSAWVGVWKELSVISKNGRNALTANYTFFTKEANPQAQQIKTQIEEAIAMGAEPGISIGAIPKKFDEVKIDGKTFKRWRAAELVEASFVPVQSNRGSFAELTKQFDLQGKNNISIKKQIKEDLVKMELNETEQKNFEQFELSMKDLPLAEDLDLKEIAKSYTYDA